MKTRVLIISSDPRHGPRERLEEEERVFVRLGRQFGNKVHLEYHPASAVHNFHSFVSGGGYDVIHFSGHGSREGIFLEGPDFAAPELVGAKRLVSLMALAEKTPLLVLSLCCYTKELVPILTEMAPFVITAGADVDSRAALTFVEAFYESFLKKRLVTPSFEHAANRLRSLNL